MNRETLSLAFALHPSTRHVAIVTGAGIFGRAWGSAARVSYRFDENRIDLIDLMGLPMPVAPLMTPIFGIALDWSDGMINQKKYLAVELG